MTIRKRAGHWAALTFALASCALSAAAMARVLWSDGLTVGTIAVGVVLGLAMTMTAAMAGALRAYIASPEGGRDGALPMRTAKVALPALGALTTIAASGAACLLIMPGRAAGLRVVATDPDLASTITAGLLAGIAMGWCGAILELARQRRWREEEERRTDP